ncbi:hypothetical protein D3C73_802240 [compost metagenome]
MIGSERDFRLNLESFTPPFDIIFNRFRCKGSANSKGHGLARGLCLLKGDKRLVVNQFLAWIVHHSGYNPHELVSELVHGSLVEQVGTVI